MGSKEKIALITHGLQEVLKGNILEDVIEKEGRPLKVYWGIYNLFLSMRENMLSMNRLSLFY